jgi:hypothetical protein
MTATRNRWLPLLGRLVPVVGLLALSPIAAEHLASAWRRTRRAQPGVAAADEPHGRRSWLMTSGRRQR